MNQPSMQQQLLHSGGRTTDACSQEALLGMLAALTAGVIVGQQAGCGLEWCGSVIAQLPHVPHHHRQQLLRSPRVGLLNCNQQSNCNQR